MQLTNASNKNAQEAITQCNEGMQKQKFSFLFNFVNEMREKVQMRFSIFKQAIKQADRAGKLD